MKFILALQILFGISIASRAQSSLDQPKSELKGSIIIEDETGISHSLREFSGHSLLLVPIYAKCHGSCPVIIEKLEHDLALSGADSSNFRVLIFSFDPEDTTKDLREFRVKHNVPPLWVIAHATPTQTANLMEGIGVRTIVDPSTKEFAHPDVISILGPQLRNSKTLGRAEISPATLRAELKWADEHGSELSKEMMSYLLPVGILGCLFSVFFLATRMTSPKS